MLYSNVLLCYCPGHTGRFLAASLSLTSLTLAAQTLFQLYLLVQSSRGLDIGSFLKNCKRDTVLYDQSDIISSAVFSSYLCLFVFVHLVSKEKILLFYVFSFW